MLKSYYEQLSRGGISFYSPGTVQSPAPLRAGVGFPYLLSLSSAACPKRDLSMATCQNRHMVYV